MTDDRGRYLVPDLPRANYKMWVRGYGLVDSPAVTSPPGLQVALTAVVAPNAQAAAQDFPANYWYSLLQVPPKEAFPMTITVPTPPAGQADVAAREAAPARRRRGNNVGAAGKAFRRRRGPSALQTQAEWLEAMKQGCELCHQIGTKATREIPPSLGMFDSSFAAWDRRVRVGQTGNNMINGVDRLGHDRAIAMFADWTDRIKAGEDTADAAAAQGRERDVVVTLWDFGRATSFPHDLAASDHRTGRRTRGGR